MSFRRDLLAYVVDAYDRRDRPVTVGDAAAALDADPDRVRSSLAALAECHLVVSVGPAAYRPTVTARELLALDVEGCVVDPGDDASGQH